MHHCNSWGIKNQLDVTCCLYFTYICSTCFNLQNGHHQTSPATNPNTQRKENKITDVVSHHHSRRLLKMDILMFETSWANISEIKTSDIKLVFNSSTIKMMHGPINIRFRYGLRQRLLKTKAELILGRCCRRSEGIHVVELTDKKQTAEFYHVLIRFLSLLLSTEWTVSFWRQWKLFRGSSTSAWIICSEFTPWSSDNSVLGKPYRRH